MIKKIGVLTSGGDSPGMNAAIRGIVRSGLYNGLEVYGIYDGYLGLFQNRVIQLNYDSVSDVINRGGTFLGSSRFPELKKKIVRSVVMDNVNKNNLDALIIIGGDGSYVGAKKLSEMGLPCIGLPGTIDNDVSGTDYTIGYFTALETIIEAIDRLRDTSSSHQRISIVEVMGRCCGDLTIAAAIAGGCEFIIIPEIEFKVMDLVNQIKFDISKGKKHAIVVITEHICNVFNLAEYIEKQTGKETRATVLGHVQRGGKPVAYDRILASRMGAHAVELLLTGYQCHCIGIRNEKLVAHKIDDSIIIEYSQHVFSKDFLQIARKLS